MSTLNFGSEACRARCYDLLGSPASDTALQTLTVGNVSANCLVACDTDTGTPPVPGLGNVRVGQSLFVSATTGDDATAVPYAFDRMYATVRAAFGDAVGGDTVYVYPGEYDETLSGAGGQLVLPANVHVYGMQLAPTTSTLINAPPFQPVTIVAELIAAAAALQPQSTICNIRLTAPLNLPAFTSPAAPPGSSRGIVYWMSCTIAENEGGGGGGLLSATVSMTSSDPLNFRDCRLQSLQLNGVQSPTPILRITDDTVANFENSSVGGVIVDAAGTTLIGVETLFDSFDNIVLLGTVDLTNCQMQCVGIAPSVVSVQSATATFEYCVVTGSVLEFAPVAQTPTYIVKFCELLGGLEFSGTDTLSVVVDNSLVATSFTSSGVDGTLQFRNNVFRALPDFIVQHAVLGGGAYSFLSNTIETDVPIEIRQTVASTVATQSMVFSQNVVVVGANTDEGSVRYTLTVLDQGNESQHIFTNNVFNFLDTGAGGGYTVDTNGPALDIVSGGNTSESGVGSNVNIAYSMAVD